MKRTHPVHLAVVAATLLSGVLPAHKLAAQALPTPFALASSLDLECRRVPPAPPPVAQVGIKQLNPVIQELLPNQVAQLGALEEVCVPVAKDGNIPAQPALSVVRRVDLACYRADAPAVELELNLSHLNPVLAGLPDEQVKLIKLEQLCVPVRKNQDDPAAPVKSIIEHVDVACYGLEEPTSDADTTLTLTHLNPVIRPMGFDDRVVDMKRARQLCVPVGKNAQPIPPVVKNLVRWLDFLKYNLEPLQGVIPPLPLTLTHLNPLFAGADSFPTVLLPTLRLMVPVAKNGVLPPGD